LLAAFNEVRVVPADASGLAKLDPSIKKKNSSSQVLESPVPHEFGVIHYTGTLQFALLHLS
jgi:hypothetical protein